MNIHKNTNSGNSGLCKQTINQTQLSFLNGFLTVWLHVKLTHLGPQLLPVNFYKLLPHFDPTWKTNPAINFQMCSIACLRFQSILVLFHLSSSLFWFQSILVLVQSSSSLFYFDYSSSSISQQESCKKSQGGNFKESLDQIL